MQHIVLLAQQLARQAAPPPSARLAALHIRSCPRPARTSAGQPPPELAPRPGCRQAADQIELSRPELGAGRRVLFTQRGRRTCSIASPAQCPRTTARCPRADQPAPSAMLCRHRHCALNQMQIVATERSPLKVTILSLSPGEGVACRVY